MTYRTTFCYPEEWYSRFPFFGIYQFHALDIAKTSCSLEACASSHWATHRSVFKGIRFNPCQNLCPQRHSKVCFKLLKTFWVTPKRHCPSERKILRSRSYRTSPASIILLFYLKSSRGMPHNFTNSGTVVNSCYIFLAMPIFTISSRELAFPSTTQDLPTR